VAQTSRCDPGPVNREIACKQAISPQQRSGPDWATNAALAETCAWDSRAYSAGAVQRTTSRLTRRLSDLTRPRRSTRICPRSRADRYFNYDVECCRCTGTFSLSGGTCGRCARISGQTVSRSVSARRGGAPSIFDAG